MRTLFLTGLVIFACSNLLLADDEIKTKDLDNSSLSATNVTTPTQENLTPAQIEELQKQSQQIKQNQIEANKYIEELDKE